MTFVAFQFLSARWTDAAWTHVEHRLCQIWGL